MPGLKDLDWGTWLIGLLRGMLGGGASAVLSAPVVSLMDPKQFNLVGWKIYGLMGSIFLFSSVTHALMYLQQSPVPPPIKTVTTMEAVTRPSSGATLTETTEKTEFSDKK